MGARLGPMKKMLLCLLLLPLPCLAQYQCTMPNGVVIVSKLSPCPVDAVKSVAPNGTITYGKPRIDKPGPVWPPVVVRPAETTNPVNRPGARELVTEAYGICALLKVAGVTTCDVKVNVFSGSFIDATAATTPTDAQAACNKIAQLTHQGDSPFVGQGWLLKIFSPLGAGTRPIAQCEL